MRIGKETLAASLAEVEVLQEAHGRLEGEQTRNDHETDDRMVGAQLVAVLGDLDSKTHAGDDKASVEYLQGRVRFHNSQSREEVEGQRAERVENHKWDDQQDRMGDHHSVERCTIPSSSSTTRARGC